MPDRTLTSVAEALFTDALAQSTIERAFAHALEPYRDEEPFTLQMRGEPPIDLSLAQRVLVFSIGKAGATMAHALLQRLHLPPGCAIEGVVVAPQHTAALPPGLACFAGGHPSPNAESIIAAHAVLAVLASAHDADFCFFLISGGASAMLELPIDPAVSLVDTVVFHRALVHSGATIAEINCVRKHFSAVKGGRLGLAASHIPNLTMLVSDVPADHLDTLASGPTVPDSTTVEQALDVLYRNDLLPQFTPAVKRFFASDRLVETPKPGAFHPHVVTLLSSDTPAEVARAKADALGFYTVIDNTCDDWDYQAAADYLLARLRELRLTHPRVCLISAGEITVKLPETAANGMGGRNQHFALYAAMQLRADDGAVAVLSAGSDGVDGNSPAAGAVVDAQTLPSLLQAQAMLTAFDSYRLLHALNATILIGATGNNLRDLRILLAEA